MIIFKKIKRLIYGKPPMKIPQIYTLLTKFSKDIDKYKIKTITSKGLYKQMSSPWFLVNAKYGLFPKIKMIKGEVGANIYSKTRYILKKK